MQIPDRGYRLTNILSLAWLFWSEGHPEKSRQRFWYFTSKKMAFWYLINKEMSKAVCQLRRSTQIGGSLLEFSPRTCTENSALNLAIKRPTRPKSTPNIVMKVHSSCYWALFRVKGLPSQSPPPYPKLDMIYACLTLWGGWFLIAYCRFGGGGGAVFVAQMRCIPNRVLVL